MNDQAFLGETSAERIAEPSFPRKLEFLFKASRYKVLYGGRGSSKSWSVARALLIEGMKRPLRILAARELQNSLDESVHKLLATQIDQMGLQEFYKVQNATITGINGTEFFFRGLRHNVASIKSFEAVDIVWVEEAQTVSKASWDILIPTIRKPGSEIWLTFNPMLETDETYKRFVLNPPVSAVVVKINWSDNPWFPDILKDEMDHLRLTDRDAWLNVWEGHCRQTLDGAIYAKELREAVEHNRITKVPYDPSKPVHTFWDLGWSDSTSIWFAQAVGFEYRILDYLEDSQRTIEHFVKLLQAKSYAYGDHWLPHDAQAKTLGSGGRTVESQLRSLNVGKVRIVPRQSVADGINAARTIFPACYFDQERCADGLQALRHYRYEVDQSTKAFSKNPLHDEHSHGADAFRYLALSLKQKSSADGIVKIKPPPTRLRVVTGNSGWMSR